MWTAIWDWGIWALLLALQLAGIALAARVVMANRSSQGTVAWVISLLLLPPVAVPLYAFLGRNRLDTYVAARRRVDRQLHHTRRKAPEPDNSLTRTEQRRRLPWRVIENLAHAPFTDGNHTDLFFEADPTFEAIDKALASARHSILFQFFIYRDDELGQRFAERLKERARAGVQVCFLVDAIGSRKLPRAFYRDLREAGVETGIFLPGRTWRGRIRVNFRNHRKIIVVDSKEAWIGGCNIGLEYTGRDPVFGHWRDTMLRVRGPVVNNIQMAFIEDWYWVNRHMPSVQWDAASTQPGGQPALCLATGPVDQEDSCTLAHVHMINQARHRLWIHTPYFVPAEEIVAALQLAVLRGVDVRVLLPSTADRKLVWLCSYYYQSLPQLRGVRFFRYHKGFFHSKMMLVDDRMVSIGTVNFDNRSFRINFEITLLLLDAEVIHRCEKQMLLDFADAWEDSHDSLAQRSFPFRLAAHSARLLSPLL